VAIAAFRLYALVLEAWSARSRCTVPAACAASEMYHPDPGEAFPDALQQPSIRRPSSS